MNKILYKKQLSDNVYQIRIEAPHIAEEREPGQFIILSVNDEFGERIPLTIADADTNEGSITLIFQAVGKTTMLLSELNEGDYIENLLGPLGNPTEIKKVGHIVCVGGGIGVAPLYPIAEAMKKAGNRLTVIIGARSKDLVIMEEEMKKIADKLIVCTDDGSYGRKDLVTIPLKEICETDKPDEAVIIGPPIMMKFCVETTRPYKVPSVVSLNSIMIDGTGMCGGCRVTVGGETKFVCVDGPEFDGHKVDFENLVNRLNSFKEQETWAKGHACRLDKAVLQGKKDPGKNE